MGYIDVKAAMKDAEEIFDQEEKLRARKTTVRNALRGAIVSGDASAEQAAWIRKEFPEQQTKTPEQRVKEARAKLEDAQKKAEKAQNSKGK